MEILKKETIKKEFVKTIPFGEIVGYIKDFFILKHENHYYLLNALMNDEVRSLEYFDEKFSLYSGMNLGMICDNIKVINKNDCVYIIDENGNKKKLLDKKKNSQYKSVSSFINGYALLYYNRLLPIKDIIDKDGNIITFKDNILLVGDYLVLGDRKSFIKIIDLKNIVKGYQIIIKKDDEEIIKTFDTVEKRDYYYEELKKEISKLKEFIIGYYNELIDDLLNDFGKEEDSLKILRNVK